MKKVTFPGEINSETEKELSDYPRLLRNLLVGRGIRTRLDADNFLNPNYENNHDPFLMKDMDKAVDRIIGAIRNDERVAIWSDYDADGVPGGIILRDFFKKIGFNSFENYIPHRHDEGFGLNSDAVSELAEKKIKLLITVDCGISDAVEIEHAKGLGIDTIVTDHHISPKEKNPALAVLDPKQEACSYPEKELCGSGVAYKLVQGLIRRGDFGLKEGWEKWLLDLVGLATLSDMVPLLGENRIFSFYGLKVLRKTPRVGLSAIFKKTGLSKFYLNEDDIVFSITPKLNAASRLGSAESAFKLLSTEDEGEAVLAATELIKINNERKGLVGSMIKEIKHTMALRVFGDGPIVLGNPNWRPSLLGLAANSLAREFGKPVFLWGRDGDNCLKGSCRSEGQTNVMELMRAASEIFTDFGGHAFSGGFTVVKNRIHELEETLKNAHVLVSGGQTDFGEEILADGILDLDEVLPENYKLISSLSPFGQGNPKPVFLFENLKIAEARNFGKESNHLELILRRNSGNSVRAISFFADENLNRVPGAGEKVNMLASFDNSVFGGRNELRLRIVDFI